MYISSYVCNELCTRVISTNAPIPQTKKNKTQKINDELSR